MKSVFLTLAANLTSLACVIGAILLAMKEKDGWGWFLGAGICLAAGAVKLGSKDASDVEEEENAAGAQAENKVSH